MKKHVNHIQQPENFALKRFVQLALLGLFIGACFVFGQAKGQTLYIGASTGSPLFNESYKAGLHVGTVLDNGTELRLSGEGSFRSGLPDMASFDLLHPVSYIGTDYLNAAHDPWTVDTTTLNNLYVGLGVDGYYGDSARRVNQAYRFGGHGIVGVETFLGRFGLFGEIQAGATTNKKFTKVKGTFRARLGVNLYF